MRTIIWTEEKKEKAIKKLTEYFENYGIGECIMQNDNALIEAPELLAGIADDILIEGEGITFELFESSFSDMIEHLDNYNTGIRKLQKTLADIQNIMNEYQISLTFVEKFISDLEDPTIF